MTTSPVVTTGEQLAETLHRLGYLIDRHSLPAPRDTRLRPVPDFHASVRVEPAEVRADMRLKNLHDLHLWAEATDAELAKVPHEDAWLHVACTVLGDMPLRMTAFGKALTP
jgi:hypothetical protein